MATIQHLTNCSYTVHISCANLAYLELFSTCAYTVFYCSYKFLYIYLFCHILYKKRHLYLNIYTSTITAIIARLKSFGRVLFFLDWTEQ